jgi:hypothetical protein
VTLTATVPSPLSVTVPERTLLGPGSDEPNAATM